ncbi:hypothetical protein LshimejAT787_0407560 [Lyophyllum shimeji]|uniref:Uncharacterized protein n=1 Tax=Lyophyllum shimeji TaxID=47721 RepID=A0A9P3UNC8_LYOSH|nr:hypothetical protein LshimejAT787_0407560 [Lyophyllum shimeji]
MVEASNSTQALGNHAPSPDNPFQGIAIDIGSDSFSKSIVERTEMDAELDRRIIGAIIRGAAKIIEKVVSKVLQTIEKDKKRRGEFTKFVVDEGRKSQPGFNWIACHTKHRTQFKGTKGVDWGHQHKEFDVSFHKTVGYEIYYVKEGEFWNQGDGGYLNWAYSGYFHADGPGNKHVVFTRPPGK